MPARAEPCGDAGRGGGGPGGSGARSGCRCRRRSGSAMASNCAGGSSAGGVGAALGSALSASKTKTKKKHFVCQKVKLFRASEPLLSVLMWGANHTVSAAAAAVPLPRGPRQPLGAAPSSRSSPAFPRSERPRPPDRALPLSPSGRAFSRPSQSGALAPRTGLCPPHPPSPWHPIANPGPSRDSPSRGARGSFPGASPSPGGSGRAWLGVRRLWCRTGLCAGARPSPRTQRVRSPNTLFSQG